MRIIEVLWSGPCTEEQVAAMNGASDRGLIAIYGSHPVFGSDALLFVDGTENPSDDEDDVERFADRIRRIRPWLDLLPSEPSIYLGRLGGTDPVTGEQWSSAISAAMRLTTFFHAPPWNARHVDHHRVVHPTVVVHLGRRHRLALEVSTLWDQSAWTPDSEEWKPFGS